MKSMDQNPKGEHLLSGLNDSIYYMGRELHVQTEDLGCRDRLIRTQVFCEGRVLLTTKVDYPVSAEGDHGFKQVTEMMRRQHFGVLREIEEKLSQRR